MVELGQLRVHQTGMVQTLEELIRSRPDNNPYSTALVQVLTGQLLFVESKERRYAPQGRELSNLIASFDGYDLQTTRHDQFLLTGVSLHDHGDHPTQGLRSGDYQIGVTMQQTVSIYNPLGLEFWPGDEVVWTLPAEFQESDVFGWVGKPPKNLKTSAVVVRATKDNRERIFGWVVRGCQKGSQWVHVWMGGGQGIGRPLIEIHQENEIDPDLIPPDLPLPSIKQPPSSSIQQQPQLPSSQSSSTSQPISTPTQSQPLPPLPPSQPQATPIQFSDLGNLDINEFDNSNQQTKKKKKERSENGDKKKSKKKT